MCNIGIRIHPLENSLNDVSFLVVKVGISYITILKEH